MTKKLYMHFSFDDVYRCFMDLTENADVYSSAFDNTFLAALKSLHEKYGAVFSLYLFNHAAVDGYSISDVTDKFCDDFKNASDWLRFGFHADEVETDYNTDGNIFEAYSLFCDSVINKFGGKPSIDNFIRLGFFAGNSNNVDVLINDENGIIGLHAADDDRLSYYLDENTNSNLINNLGFFDDDKGLVFVRSQKRLEHISSDEEMFKTLSDVKSIGDIKILEIFSHEQDFKNDVPGLMEECCIWANNNDYEFVFTEDIADDLRVELQK